MKRLILSLIVISAIFSTLVFSTGVECFAENISAKNTPTMPQTPTAQPAQQVPTNQITPAEQSSTPDFSQKNSYELAHMGENSPKSKILKFFIAMLGVLLSAAAIFGGLKFYKKFILKNNSKNDKINYEKTLESPKDFKEAINIFLEKTDK